ncbi:MAG TPA: retroviral-like aspartic protease family protein [Gemmataceae bacterium]|nr:retroviral-like aspartic protease family protein [Gemmataceae bacterium]
MIQRGEEIMGRISIEVELTNAADLVRAQDGTLAADKVRRVRMTGLVDTGASYLVIPESIAQQLGVPEKGQAKVSYADRRTETRKVVDQVNVALLGRDGTFKAIVEPARNDVLLGAIVLEDLDLLVDCRTQTVHPRDPNTIIAEIE